MKAFSIFATLTCLLILVACTKDIGPNPDLVKVAFCDTISFSKHVKPVIEANCVTCHKPGGPGNGDYETDMYPVLKSKVDNGSLRARAIDLTVLPTMPKFADPLSEETRSMLRCWVEAGAPNN